MPHLVPLREVTGREKECVSLGFASIWGRGWEPSSLLINLKYKNGNLMCRKKKKKKSSPNV